ncbi:MAG: type II toxin-antitoxin system RelE/ParE family toxin [Microscillaceae bacterium]|jgi:plasmid stabilization system protein ParE|nr:type II toxin-antitoxin system RelE/ParE family toxin [Microscillaceae bacterium]
MPENNQNYQIIIGEKARQDVQDVVDWYESQKSDLGIDFFLYFEDKIKVLETNPKLYPTYFDYFRRFLLKKYPYAIYYLIDEVNFNIEIIALFHSSRNTESIHKRLSNS